MARTIHTLGLLLLLLPVGGCIGEDLSECRVTEAVFLRVIDIASGQQITDSTRVIDATLFVFDENRGFLERINVTGDQLESDIRIPLSAYTGDKIYVSAWGNIAGRIELLKITPGESLSRPFLSLSEADDPVYRLCPGETFFGLKEIDLSALPLTRSGAEEVVRRHEIDITQKNARLMITVRGLPVDADSADYYFQLCKQNCGYDFLGNPTADSVEIREAGTFNADREFISPAPFYLIHSVDPDNIDAQSGMVLHLFQVAGTRAGDTDLTGAVDKDRNGNYIALTSGKTTNVLIDLTDTGGDGDSGSVYVEIVETAWDEIHRWTIQEVAGN